MKDKKFGMDQKCRRTNKDSARFAKAFENAACRNSNMSLANIVFRVMSGEGCYTYKTDMEFAADLDATENVYRSWVYKFISGEASMDQWDQYVTEWQAAGGTRLTDYARTVLDPSN